MTAVPAGIVTRTPQVSGTSLDERDVMRESWIEFIRLPYEDDAWHMTMSAADAEYRVEQEFYTYPSDLIELANCLQSFPKHGSDEVRFEVGSRDPSWAHWVFLRAFIVDTTGHAALVVVGNNGDDFRMRSARFTIRCDVGSLNRLGAELRRWINEPGRPLHQRLHVS